MSKKKVDEEKAIKLITEHGLSQAQVAKIQGVSPQAISQALQDYADRPLTNIYKEKRADIYAGKQATILNELDDATIKRMKEKHPGAMALWFNSLFNAERLERNQSTVITDHNIRALGVLVNAIPTDSETIIDAEPVDN